MRLPTAPDNTGCNHDVREVFGIFQCNQCGRTFNAFGGVYSAEESRLPPEPVLSSMEASYVRMSIQLEQVADLAAVLAERPGTKAVARRLRAILEGLG